MTSLIDREQAVAVEQKLLTAMTGADTRLLTELLDPTYTLTHMTGYVQSKAEWLEEISTGSMIYHSIESADLTVTESRSAVTVDHRTHTDATIWGSRHTWPLRLRTEVSIDDVGTPVVAKTVATTW